MVLEVPLLVIKDLIYDMILGTDALNKINAVIDFNSSILMCTINNKCYNVKLGQIDIDYESDSSDVRIIKPHTRLLSNGNNNNSNNIDKLTAIQQSKLDKLLSKHRQVFENNQTTTDVYVHQIRVTDENKFIRKTYPIPLHYQKQVDEEITKKLENNIIERSDRNFLNAMVVVKKKNNEIRICLDTVSYTHLDVYKRQCIRS